jgi:hypothetical protein
MSWAVVGVWLIPCLVVEALAWLHETFTLNMEVLSMQGYVVVNQGEGATSASGSTMLFIRRVNREWLVN